MTAGAAMRWKNVFVFRFYQCFAKCKCKDHSKVRTETCGERNPVWQLGFARDVLALYPTGHLARVSQAFRKRSGRENSYSRSACVLVVFSLRYRAI